MLRVDAQPVEGCAAEPQSFFDKGIPAAAIQWQWFRSVVPRLCGNVHCLVDLASFQAAAPPALRVVCAACLESDVYSGACFCSSACFSASWSRLAPKRRQLGQERLDAAEAVAEEASISVHGVGREAAAEGRARSSSTMSLNGGVPPFNLQLPRKGRKQLVHDCEFIAEQLRYDGDWVAIEGAADAWYRPSAEDVGHALRACALAPSYGLNASVDTLPVLPAEPAQSANRL